jgi:hypothetical protein
MRCGNSLVEPPAPDAPRALADAFAALPADTRAFDWQAAFPAVFARGGFDVVVGNPPYVRQEVLGPFKPYLAQCYAAYHGVADLYVYFYERGLGLLAPEGKLSFIVTNKWLRAGYGEPLRRLFKARAELEEILDFGHTPIFEDADTFPCILIAHPLSGAARGNEDNPQVRVCPVPRDRPAELSLDNYVHEHGYPVPWGRYGAEPWSLEPPEVDELMRKIGERGVPLVQFVGARPMYGIKTGLNEAFLIDDATRMALIRDDPGCSEIVKPYLRGQDIKRWVPQWQGLWMIFARRGIDIDSYPSVKAHLTRYRDRLEPRPGDWNGARLGDWPGRKPGTYAWYEIQDSVDYWRHFEEPKIVHTDIAWRPQFAYSDQPLYFVNTCYFWSTQDLFALAAINSPVLWAYMWRHAQHGKDEALRLFNSFTTTLPIAEPSPEIRAEVEDLVASLLGLTHDSQDQTRELLSWLRLELDIEQPGQRLESFAALSGPDFAAEVRKRRPKGAARLTPRSIAELIATHDQYADRERERAARMHALERRVSDLVNLAYRLTDDEMELLWRTAPPRMPGRPMAN